MTPIQLVFKVAGNQLFHNLLSYFSEAKNENFRACQCLFSHCLGSTDFIHTGMKIGRSREWFAIYFCPKSLDDCTLGDNGASPVR